MERKKCWIQILKSSRESWNPKETDTLSERPSSLRSLKRNIPGIYRNSKIYIKNSAPKPRKRSFRGNIKNPIVKGKATWKFQIKPKYQYRNRVKNHGIETLSNSIVEKPLRNVKQETTGIPKFHAKNSAPKESERWKCWPSR